MVLGRFFGRFLRTAQRHVILGGTGPGVSPAPSYVVLEEAENLLKDPGSWCTGADGLNDAGESVSPYKPECRQRCLGGAIAFASYNIGSGKYSLSPATIQLMLVTVRWLAGGQISDCNDAKNRTHAEVLGILRQGVAVLEEAAALGQRQ